jgi:hypothetical protein
MKLASRLEYEERPTGLARKVLDMNNGGVAMRAELQAEGLL